MLTLNRAESRLKHHPRPTPSAACSWCAGSAEEDGCSHHTEGNKEEGSYFSEGGRDAIWRGRGKKNPLFPQQLKEGLLEQVAGGCSAI